MMRSFFLIFSFLILCISLSFSENWGEAGFWFGSNNFVRNDISFLTRISTRVVGGINASYYKAEKQKKVYSLRLPLNILISRNISFSAKPFYYPENGDKISAYGSRIAVLYHLQNEQKEFSCDWNISFSIERQKFPTGEISNKAIELQFEQNYYDQFYIGLIFSSLINPENPDYSVKRYAEISDIISPNVFAFIDDVVYNNLGVRLARSLKPDYDSYLYAGFDKLNCRYSDYNSYLAGIKIYFLDKNFMDFSYNYLSILNSRNKAYYKINIGVFF